MKTTSVFIITLFSYCITIAQPLLGSVFDKKKWEAGWEYRMRVCSLDFKKYIKDKPKSFVIKLLGESELRESSV